jgi:histidyl-tRNA synthetase
VVIGDDEVAANAVMLKPLRGGEQQRVALNDLQQKIRELNLSK